MTADLDRSVASVCDLKGDRRSVLVQDNVARCCENLARYHLSHASTNWVVNAHEFRSIGKSCFHLHLGNHLWDAFHHLVTAQHLATFRHEFCTLLSIAGRFQEEIGYERNTLGIVELDTSLKPLPSDNCGKCDHQLVFLTRREVHKRLRSAAISSTTTFSVLGRVRSRAPVRIAGESCAMQASNQRTLSRQSERRSVRLPTSLHNCIPGKE